jgi:hypothetical protein
MSMFQLWVELNWNRREEEGEKVDERFSAELSAGLLWDGGVTSEIREYREDDV